MVSRDVAALFMENMPDDEIRSLRDSIAKAEVELTRVGTLSRASWANRGAEG